MRDPSRVRVSGPLEPFAAGFAAELSRQGFTPGSACKQLTLFAHLSRWLATEGLEPGALSPELAERFCEARRAAGYTQLLTAKALSAPLAYLRGLGVAPPACTPVRVGPVEELLGRFGGHLERERGLARATARRHVALVRPFLERFAGPDGVELGRLDALAVRAFVLELCPRQSRSATKRAVGALRALLCYLHLEGELERSLLDAAPSVASWRLSGLPKRLESEQVQSLLAACKRETPAGLRDFAILTVLWRMGLRAGEVAALSLDDINWRAGEILVRGKGPTFERMPLPCDVGEAVADYLRAGRPASAAGRTVFVRVRAPHRMLSATGVSQIVAAAARRAGLGTVHAHRLRHTAASEMLRAGAGLPEIGQALRHRHALSTAIYAKVDRETLRTIARPWPEALA